MTLVLVTGGSTGLGLATAAELSAAGHDVVLHARNTDRLAGLDLRDQVYDLAFADLADVVQTVRLAEHLERYGRFDAVIHNAGVVGGPSVFAVNLIAPYLLSALMTPPLRTIVLSSSMHKTGSADLDTLDLDRPDNRQRPYDDSKLYVTALAMALGRMRPDTLAHAVDPGWVPTRMGGRSATDDLAEGHRTQTWLATADPSQIKPRTGGYWYHRRSRPPHSATLDAEFQTDLLNRLEAHTGFGLRPANGPND